MRSRLITLIFLSFFILAPFVSAEEATVTPRGVQNREVVKTNIANKKEEIQLRITAVKRERIMSHFGKMKVRLEALVERIEILINRLDSRILKTDTLTGEDKLDTEKAKEDIDLAKLKLAKVKLLITNLTIDDTLNSETPKETFAGVSDEIKLIKTELKEIHVLLVQTIGDLRGLRVGDTNNEE